MSTKPITDAEIKQLVDRQLESLPDVPMDKLTDDQLAELQRVAASVLRWTDQRLARARDQQIDR